MSSPRLRRPRVTELGFRGGFASLQTQGWFHYSESPAVVPKLHLAQEASRDTRNGLRVPIATLNVSVHSVAKKKKNRSETMRQAVPWWDSRTSEALGSERGIESGREGVQVSFATQTDLSVPDSERES